MMNNKALTKDKKWLVHSINTAEYKDYSSLSKKWPEAEEYSKSKVLLCSNKSTARRLNINLFLVIYSDFLILLKNFKSSKAINLYLYCAFEADYEAGFFKADFAKISTFFRCTERAIYKWLKELENLELILVKKQKGNHYIFMRPYNFNNGFKYSEKEDFNTLKEQYLDWIKYRKSSKSTFLILHNNFKKYLRTLSGGAVKLYLYCCLNTNKFKSRKDSGTFHRSLELISMDLSPIADSIDVQGISLKSAPNINTLCRWFKELKENNLVEKYQRRIGSASTIYVKPLVKIKNIPKGKNLL